MQKLVSILALLAAVAPAPLLAQTRTERFTRDGQTYVYTVSDAAGGRRVIEGRRLPAGSSFRLVVTGDRVDGMSGGVPVSFRVPARASVVTVAAR
jgi:hypothetical protein